MVRPLRRDGDKRHGAKRPYDTDYRMQRSPQVPRVRPSTLWRRNREFKGHLQSRNQPNLCSR